MGRATRLFQNIDLPIARKSFSRISGCPAPAYSGKGRWIFAGRLRRKREGFCILTDFPCCIKKINQLYYHSTEGPIAQRSEPPAHNRLVQGSNPCGPTILPFKGRLAQLVRVRRSHRRGHWFDSSIAHQFLRRFWWLSMKNIFQFCIVSIIKKHKYLNGKSA